MSGSGWAATVNRAMQRIDLIPERSPDGTVVLRAVVVGPVERLRRLVQLIVRPQR